MSRSTLRFTVRHVLLGAVGALILAACSPVIDTRGNLPPAARLSQLKPGEQTREDVAQLLGTPATVSTFGDPVWYYISYRTETSAFFKPEELDRKVLAIEFDTRGYLKDVRQLGLSDGRELQMVDRETPTAGKDLTVLQQMFGNLGRFSKEGTPNIERGGLPSPSGGTGSGW